MQLFLRSCKKYAILINGESDSHKNPPVTNPPHYSSVENLFAICISARRKRGEREDEGEAKEEKQEAVGEDGYEGEEGGGRPCSDVGATAAL